MAEDAVPPQWERIALDGRRPWPLGDRGRVLRIVAGYVDLFAQVIGVGTERPRHHLFRVESGEIIVDLPSAAGAIDCCRCHRGRRTGDRSARGGSRTHRRARPDRELGSRASAQRRSGQLLIGRCAKPEPDRHSSSPRVSNCAAPRAASFGHRANGARSDSWGLIWRAMPGTRHCRLRREHGSRPPAVQPSGSVARRRQETSFGVPSIAFTSLPWSVFACALQLSPRWNRGGSPIGPILPMRRLMSFSSDLAAVIVPRSRRAEYEEPGAGPLFASMPSCRRCDRRDHRSTSGRRLTRHDFNDVTEIARASRLRMRQTLLRPDWWRWNVGPLIAWRGEARRPVALIPMSRRYVMLEPGSPGHRIVDESLASGVGGRGRDVLSEAAVVVAFRMGFAEILHPTRSRQCRPHRIRCARDGCSDFGGASHHPGARRLP